jgi:excisionase family DNA binding protein
MTWPVPGGEATTCGRCTPAAATGPARSLSAGAPAENKLLLSREEAAALLGVSPDTFDRHARHRIGARMVGNRPMFSADAVRAYSKTTAKDLT